jgi:Mrp family chromosome partitioning ATPase
LIVAIALFCSLAAGVIWVFVLERVNTRFRADVELGSEAKAPCLGTFTEGSPSTSSETARAIVMAAGLTARTPQSKILLVTCSLPGEGATAVSTALAHSLVRMGKRSLLLDLSREAPAPSRSLALENVLDGIERHAFQLDEPLTVVRSASEAGQDEGVVTSRNFSRLLEQARDKCDLVIIVAPPVMISADALYLGRQADFVLHVVRWNSTPRRVALTALKRLRSFGVPVDSVTLSRVKDKEVWSLNWSGPIEKSHRKSGETGDVCV